MNVNERTPNRMDGKNPSNSYTQGFNSQSLVVSGTLASNVGKLDSSPQPLRKHESSASPMRFCVQTKDRFVVRVVKVTDKSVIASDLNPHSRPSMPIESLRSIRQDSQQMQNLHKIILEAVRDKNPSIFVGFQAQLPAIAPEHVYKSTSADQVNRPNDTLIYHKSRMGKGIRLCFSCPLTGNGLNICDFLSGKVYQRLESWEKSSERLGILTDVLHALKNTVDLLLEQMQLDGLLSVLPETDYIFYPHTPHLLLPQHTLQPLSRSLDSTASRCTDVPVFITPNGTCVPQMSHSAASSPIVVPTGEERGCRQLSILTVEQGLQRQQNPLVASVITTSRPLSSYGTCFDGSTVEKKIMESWDRKLSLSSSEYGFPVRQLSGRSPVGSSTAWLTSHHESPVCSTYECGETDSISAACHTCSSNQNRTGFSTAKETDPITMLINEVSDRLRKNPHLPLVVMPTQVSGSPPLVFQLPSPDVIFVGLPAVISQNGRASERPRLITSPADNSAFVVTSKRSINTKTNLLPTNSSPLRADVSRFTITAPQPGSILGVSSEGDLFLFKPS